MRKRETLTLLILAMLLLSGLCLGVASHAVTEFSDDFTSSSWVWTRSPAWAWTQGGGVYTGDAADLSYSRTCVPVFRAFSLDVDLVWLLSRLSGSPNYGVAGFILKSPNSNDASFSSIHVHVNKDPNGNVCIGLVQFSSNGSVLINRQSQVLTTTGNSFHLRLVRPEGTNDTLQAQLTGDINGGVLNLDVTGITNLDVLTQNGLKLYNSAWTFDNYRVDAYGARVLGSSIRSYGDPIIASAATQNLFAAWGKAGVIDPNWMTLNDGSPLTIDAYVPGHAVQDLDFARVEGVLCQDNYRDRRVLVGSGQEPRVFDHGFPGSVAPQSAILIGENGDLIEQQAARELAKYLKLMTGSTVPVAIYQQSLETAQNVFLIGRPETNSKIQALNSTGYLTLSSSFPGLDGFIIKTVQAGGKRYIVVGGSSDRGTLYGVYHLLEKVFHVGFFEDGEYAPKYSSVVVPDLNIAERPAFQLRQYLSICSDVYTGSYWLLPEWQYECDFAAKKKQNLLNVDLPWNIYAYLKRNVERQYGVVNSTMPLVGPPSPADDFDVELYKQIVDYARDSLGAKILGPVGIATVSAGFRQAYPNLSYVYTTDMNSTSSLYIDPADPAFKEYLAKYFTLHNKLFGTDHYYYIPAMGLETLESEWTQYRPTLRAEYGQAAFEAVRSIDPQAVVFTDGWGYMQWPASVVQSYCNAFPQDGFLTHDMWGELPTHSKYQPFNYYYGKDWLLGVLHSFAGDECMFGDMQRVIDMYNAVLADPGAVNCMGTAIMPEIVDHNPIYWDLLLNTTWNPNGLTVDDHLHDVALRRYGNQSSAALYPALKKLRESVYGPYEMIGIWPHAPRPMYRRKLADIGPEVAQYSRRFVYIPKLREAVEIMLAEAGQQNGNKLYNNDLTETCNQYISELMDYYVVQLYNAFTRGDEGMFEQCAAAVDDCFDAKELLLSSNSRYYLETEIDQSVRRMEASGRIVASAGQSLYTIMAGLARHSYANPAMTEYWGKDKYEIVKHYYRNKMHTWVNVLRNKMAAGQNTVSAADVDSLYDQAAQSYWNDDSANMSQAEVYQGTVAQAATQALQGLAGLPLQVMFSDDFSADTGAWTAAPVSAWTLSGGTYTADYADFTCSMTNVPAAGAFSLDVDSTWLMSKWPGHPNYGVAGFVLRDPNSTDPFKSSFHAHVSKDDNGNVTLAMVQFDGAGNVIVYRQSQTLTTVGNTFHLKLTRPAGTTGDMELLLTGDVNGGQLYMYEAGLPGLDALTRNGLKMYLSSWRFDNFVHTVR